MTREGTVSHGTMNPEHLIPRFCGELSRIFLGTDENGQWVLNELGAIGSRMAHESYFESEAAEEDLSWLFDRLDQCSPEGMYFGAHPVDGSDFGFWRVEPGQ